MTASDYVGIHHIELRININMYISTITIFESSLYTPDLASNLNFPRNFTTSCPKRKFWEISWMEKSGLGEGNTLLLTCC